MLVQPGRAQEIERCVAQVFQAFVVLQSIWVLIDVRAMGERPADELEIVEVKSGLAGEFLWGQFSPPQDPAPGGSQSRRVGPARTPPRVTGRDSSRRTRGTLGLRYAPQIQRRSTVRPGPGDDEPHWGCSLGRIPDPGSAGESSEERSRP